MLKRHSRLACSSNYGKSMLFKPAASYPAHLYLTLMEAL